jgi:phage repressor protein C with HTH and peptisase S24 domain
MAKKNRVQSNWISNALAEDKTKSQKGLAEHMGLDQSQGHRIASGARTLRAPEVALVEHYLGKRAPVELTGQEDRFGEGSALVPMAEDVPRGFLSHTAEDFLPVPVHDQRAAAGSGALATDGPPIDYVMFRKIWLRRRSNNINRLFVLEITGDSDLPFLHSGDHALVDPGQTNPAREGRYIIRIDDELLVKIVSMNPQTRLLTVKSGNPDYPTWPNLPPDSVNIIGRVIWIGRNIG